MSNQYVSNLVKFEDAPLISLCRARSQKSLLLTFANEVANTSQGYICFSAMFRLDDLITHSISSFVKRNRIPVGAQSLDSSITFKAMVF